MLITVIIHRCSKFEVFITYGTADRNHYLGIALLNRILHMDFFIECKCAEVTVIHSILTKIPSLLNSRSQGMALKFLQDKHTFGGDAITFLWCKSKAA